MNVSDYHKKTDDFINSNGFVTRNTQVGEVPSNTTVVKLNI